MRLHGLLALVVAGVLVASAAAWTAEPTVPASLAAPFQPPPDSAIPAGPFGDVIRFGENVFKDPAAYAPAYVGNQLHCSNCHLDDGRRAGSAPMWAAWTAYPAFRSKNGHVNSFEERLQGCFRYSMNGRVPPLGDPVLVALESYAYFLAHGLPTGERAPGGGYPKLAKPALAADYARGGTVFAEKCAACHGKTGLGQIVGGKPVFPALWGPASFNWGAGMASVKNAAEFIHANMPYGQGGTLTPQQAWDVALFVDSQVRPQDPRFTGDVAQTRATFHNTPSSMYGQTVNGAVLGDPAATPPAGTVPAQPAAPAGK